MALCGVAMSGGRAQGNLIGALEHESVRRTAKVLGEKAFKVGMYSGNSSSFTSLKP